MGLQCEEKTIGEEWRSSGERTMNSLRSAGIALMVFGVVTILVSPITLYYPHYPGVGNDTTPFYTGLVLGIVLVAVGVYLKYFGGKKDKKGV